MASAVRSGSRNATATATGRGRRAPARWSCASPSCAKAAGPAGARQLAPAPYDRRLNVLLRQHAEPISERRASKFGQPRVEVFGSREYGGVKMKFNSSYWYKRATEMRSVANETKNLQSKETMLGIAHAYDLLGCQFEYREKCALRDVIGTEPFVHSAKGPEGAGPWVRVDKR